jgi:hypothetical protein
VPHFVPHGESHRTSPVPERVVDRPPRGDNSRFVFSIARLRTAVKEVDHQIGIAGILYKDGRGASGAEIYWTGRGREPEDRGIVARVDRRARDRKRDADLSLAVFSCRCGGYCLSASATTAWIRAAG